MERLDYTFDQGGSTPGRKHKFRPGDGAWYEVRIEADDSGEATPHEWYRQYCYVVDWAVKNGRGHYRVVRMTGGHLGATPWGRPIWMISYELHPTGRWWHGLLMQYRANERLEERGCTCNCCVHEAIPRSTLNRDGTFKEGY